MEVSLILEGARGPDTHVATHDVPDVEPRRLVVSEYGTPSTSKHSNTPTVNSCSVPSKSSG